MKITRLSKKKKTIKLSPGDFVIYNGENLWVIMGRNSTYPGEGYDARDLSGGGHGILLTSDDLEIVKIKEVIIE